MHQNAQTVLTGSAVTALGRATWGADDLPMPATAKRAADAPSVPRDDAPVERVRRCDMRFLEGGPPPV